MRSGRARGILVGLMLALALGSASGSTRPTGVGPDPRSGLTAGDPVDLGTGLYIRSHVDIVLPGQPPIRFTRTYVNRDERSRAFGIGAMHSYDLFLVGDSATFSAIDIIRDDGARIHFVRTSPGTGLSDAVLEHTGTSTEFNRGILRWNGHEWTIDLQNGGRYRFRGCYGNVRPGQCGVVEYRDAGGKVLSIERSPAGDVTSITNADGFRVMFTYDGEHRITRARTGIGWVMAWVRYEYDQAGRLSRVHSERIDFVRTVLDTLQWLFGRGSGPGRGWSSETSEYTYDQAHQLVSIREPHLFIVNEYDSDGFVVRQTVNRQDVFRFAYQRDGTGRVRETEVTKPDGVRRRVAFDDRGVPTGTVWESGTPREVRVEYEREPGTNRVAAMSVRCVGAGGTEARRATVAPGEDHDLMELRLLEACGLAAAPGPLR